MLGQDDAATILAELRRESEAKGGAARPVGFGPRPAAQAKAKVAAKAKGDLMRHSRQEDLLRLAVMMQGSVEGVSVSDIGQTFGVSRRMAERMRDAVLRAFPNWRSVPVRTAGNTGVFPLHLGKDSGADIHSAE
ncbi:hypothetical protein [Paracoccus sp. (in: a-proteobacteria)]|uniref:hypothetical protein n=1 Tax=Paracoccus sp. TaxID=267 RepID=UPI0033403ECC